MRKKLIAFLIMFILIVSTVPALAYEPTADDMIPDVLVVRPISLVASAVGVVIFVVALPVSIPSGSVEKVGERLVVDPFKYTFVRPIGNFDEKQGT
jgi:hypothetical protein